MKNSIPTAMAVAISIIPLSSASAGPAATMIDSCDFVIETTGGRYALSQDITCTSSSGILIRSPVSNEPIQRIQVSLNGYTIDGSGVTGSSFHGIDVYDSSRVTITGPGRITGFNATNTNRGIVIGRVGATTNNVSVSGLIVDNNDDGIVVNGSATSGVEIKNNVVIGNADEGIFIGNNTFGNTFEQNEVLYNPGGGINIRGGCDNNTVIGNNASYNGGVTYDNIYVGSGTNGTLIYRNIATDAGDYDIDNDSGTNTTVNNNTCFNGSGTDDCDPPLSSDFHIDH